MVINRIVALDWIWPEPISNGMVVTSSAVWGVSGIPGHRNTRALAIGFDYSFKNYQGAPEHWVSSCGVRCCNERAFEYYHATFVLHPTWVHWQSISSLASGQCSRPSHRCRPYMHEPSSHLTIKTLHTADSFQLQQMIGWYDRRPETRVTSLGAIPASGLRVVVPAWHQN